MTPLLTGAALINLPAEVLGLARAGGNPLLRRIVATTGIFNFSSTLSFTLLPILLLRELGLSAAAMGVIFSLGAVGGFAGAIATPHIVPRIGEARAIPVSAIAFNVVACLLPLAALAAGALGTWLGVVPTVWIGAAGQVLSALFVVVGPFWALRALPDATA